MYRVTIIKHLSQHIKADTCYKLLLGSDDSEIVLSFSAYDKKHASVNARYIEDALHILVDMCDNGIATTWIGCCEMALIKNYGIVKRAQAIADWYLQLHEFKSMQFRRSQRGRQ